MRFHRYLRRVRLGIELVAERQEHYQYKFRSDRWHTGYMESLYDTTPARDYYERLGGSPREDTIFRGVTRRVFRFHVWFGWLDLDATIVTPFRVDPEWDQLGGIETSWNEVTA